MRETLQLTKQQAQEIVHGDHLGFSDVSEKIIGQRRWVTVYEKIVERVDGKFFKIIYELGSTEMQDQQPFEFDNEPIEFEEVFPTEKTVIVYE